MKTRTFTSFDADSDVGRFFKRDLKILLGLPVDARTAAMETASTIAEAMTASQKISVLEKYAKNHNITVAESQSVFQSLNYLLLLLDNEESAQDSANDTAEDLITLSILQQTDVPSFIDLLNTLRTNALPRFKQVQRHKSFAAGVLPSLKSFGTTVELRAVIQNEFRIGMSADTYQPEISELIPVVSVKIRLDSGVVDQIAFQASAREIEALIEELRSSLVCAQELNRLRNSLSLLSSSSETSAVQGA